MVIANAGISVGIDTAEAADLEVMRATFETNVLGMASTFHPFVAAMQRAPLRAAGRHRQRGRHPRLAGRRRLLRQQGGGDQPIAKALRGEMRPSGVKVVTIAPGYIDTPLTRGNRYSMPFLMSAADFADARLARRSKRGTSWRVIPWQMGVVAGLLRLLPNALYDRVLAGRPRKRRQTEE